MLKVGAANARPDLTYATATSSCPNPTGTNMYRTIVLAGLYTIAIALMALPYGLAL
ncbi:hypothetical protein GCM10010862_03400 [Devosia nitrariae]|uniref:Uncharacterized protein n=1 Tax=Devosia nitrariae TaxID=2071872 RepID=A0ABQ5VZD6_9HYPH|nr:hypothetical protein GCM10010862_03400 [Devosia nitrariae]